MHLAQTLLAVGRGSVVRQPLAILQAALDGQQSPLRRLQLRGDGLGHGHIGVREAGDERAGLRGLVKPEGFELRIRHAELLAVSKRHLEQRVVHADEPSRDLAATLVERDRGQLILHLGECSPKTVIDGAPGVRSPGLEAPEAGLQVDGDRRADVGARRPLHRVSIQVQSLGLVAVLDRL